MNQQEESVETAAPETSSTTPVTRGTFLKSAATATGALLAAPAAAALAASPASKMAAPYFAPPPEGTVLIWDRSGDLFQVFGFVIASFIKKYPRITVKHVAVDVDAKLPATLATGVGVPDGSFYEDDFLVNQRAHYYDITEWMQPYAKDIVPFKLQVNTANGRILGVPWDLDPALLWYREDLLHKAGVDPASIKTYDDLLTAARTLKSKLGIKPIALERDPNVTLLWIEMFANQQNTSLVDANGKLQIGSAPYLKILQWINTVNQEGLGTRTSNFAPDDVAAVNSGQVAFHLGACWFIYGIQFLFKKTVGLWRAMPLPAWTPGGRRGASMGGSSFFIPKQAKNPYLAWLWYEYLMFNPAGYRLQFGPNKLYPGGLNTVLSSYKPSLAHQLFQNPAALGGQNLWNVEVGTVKDISDNYYYPTWYTQAANYLSADVQLMLDGKLTPQQAQTKSAHDIQVNLVNRA